MSVRARCAGNPARGLASLVRLTAGAFACALASLVRLTAGASARALAAVLACALAPALLAPAPAPADVFGPISLVSRGSLGGREEQQAEYAHDTAISEDGRYVVFDGSIGGVTGVWRRDLQTGALQQVAGGDAELPSISAEGQYISFTTNEGKSLPGITYGLLGARPQAGPGTKEAVNVYVRDMARGPGESGAFILASAANSSTSPEQPLIYQATEPEKYGSLATGRSAISANGDEVAFVTTAVSNLVSYPKLEKEEEEKGETPKPHTPAFQVAVRYLHAHETKLVSRCYVACEAASEPAVESVEGGQVYGALYPGLSTAFAPAPPYGEYGPSPPPGASISADGSTVAWIGESVGRQAQMLAQESGSPHYTEPLWRRIEPGSETSTERVTGGSDPTNPACVASGETALPLSASISDPCQGPFVVTEQPRVTGIINASGGPTGDYVPRLSADGYTVAFVSQAPLVALGEDFGREKNGQSSDLYIASMRPGLTRDQALVSLTELAGGEGASIAATAPIFDFEVAPDGSQVAFVTRRTQFILGSPAYVSPPAGEPGLNELFDIDLRDDTLTRVTHGYTGPSEPGEHAHTQRASGVDPYEDPGDGSLSPSMSADGSILAFSSTASNLSYGDGNAPPTGQVGPLDGSDAFVVDRRSFTTVQTQQLISPAPPLATEPAWQLGVSALTKPDGSVLLYVSAPGAGTLRAAAQSSIVLAVAGGSARSAHRHPGHGARRVRAMSGRHESHEVAVTRTVAVASEPIETGTVEPTVLALRLAKRYAALASRQGGLSASVNVTFSAPGERTLRQSVAVSFVRHARAARRSSRSARRRAIHGSRRR